MKKGKTTLIKSVSMLLVVLICIGNIIFAVPESGLFMRASAGSAENKNSFIAPIEEPDASATKISTPEELSAIRNDMYGSYVLVNDIDMSSYGNWTPIGKTLSEPFYGKFDGQGFKITGLTVTSSFNSGTLLAPYYTVGLFGVCNGAQIKNLILEDVDISINTTSGYYYDSALDSGHSVFSGAFIGYASNNTVVYNCHCSGTVSADASGEGYSDTIAGGLVGYAGSSILSYCYNNAEVSAYNGNSVQAYDAYAGGLVGYANTEGIIDCCYNSGAISAQTRDYGNAYVGGLAGDASTSSLAITNSFNEGRVQAVAGNMFCDDTYAGGIVGNFSGSISNTYNSGAVYSQSKDAYGISDGNAYAGGIAAKSTSASQIKNSAIVQSTVSATAAGSKYQYRISYQGTKSNNITINQVTSGSINDANIVLSLDNMKLSSPYIDELGWDFDTIWELVEGKDFPQLKQINVKSEDYINDYIDQHLEFIDSAEYANFLANYRWAQIYWSQENNFKSNVAGALYKTLDIAVDLVNLRFADLFEDGNPYKILVADYVADQVVQEEIVKLYESNVPPEFKKIYSAVKAFIEKYWDDGWGELSDEDLFWLFHYDERDGEYWINSNFEDHLDEIVRNERASEELWQAIFSVPFEQIDSILKKISEKEKKAEALFEFMTYAAHVNAYVAADEEFKMILDLMCENLPDNSEEGLTHKAMLYTAIKSYTQYNDSENVAARMYANYIAGVKLEEFKSQIFKHVDEKVNSWMNANFSSAALQKLKAIGWAADTTWKIVDYITKNGELQDCREMLRANAYFESTVYNTLKSLESDFVTSPTIENAYLFDAAFRLFKEAQIYSMDTCITYMDTYQNAWLPAIRNLSNTFMNSAIEEVHINKLFIYYSYCHGIKYNLGGKVITVACPTDVAIYDEKDNLVAYIENDVVTQCNDGILAYTTDAVKIIVVPLDQEYSIRITGTDSGYMDYSVSEFDAQMNNVQTTLYSDISVEKDSEYEGQINNVLKTEPDTYNLSNTSTTISDYKVITEANNVAVTGLEITTAVSELYIGDTGVFSAQIAPADATVQSIVWRSSDEDVLVIGEDGKYIAVSEGKVTVTASSIYGGASDAIEVTVISADENAEFLKDLYALVEPLSETVTNNEQHDNIISMLNMYDSLTDYQKSCVDAEHDTKIETIRTNYEAYNNDVVNAFVNDVDRLYADHSSDDLNEINALSDRYEEMHQVQKAAVPADSVEKLNALIKYAEEQSQVLPFYALLDPLSETVTSDDQIDDILAMFDAYNALTGAQQSYIDAERSSKINTIYNNLNAYNQAKADTYSEKVDVLYEDHSSDDIDAIVELVNEYNALHGTQKALVSDETITKIEKLIEFAESQSELAPFYAILDLLPETVTTQAEADAAQAMLDAYNALTNEQKANIDSERKVKIEVIRANLASYNEHATVDKELEDFYAILDPLPETVTTQAEANAAQAMLDAYDALADEQKGNIDSERRAKIDLIAHNLEYFVPNLTGSKTGTFGDDLKWELTKEYYLIISGTGAMPDFASLEDTPWCDYRHGINSVIINSGVTSIGDNAFAGFDAMLITAIPSTVECIGESAYAECNKLTALHIPKNVKSIGEYAFYKCELLENIVLYSGVEEISDNAFDKCLSIEQIYFIGNEDDWAEIHIGDNNENFNKVDVSYGVPILYYNGHYYMYTIVTGTNGRIDGLEYCNNVNGHLLTISDEEENNTVYSYLTSIGKYSAYFGFSDEVNEGNWKWDTGETVSYTNWAFEEPSGGWNSEEDVGMFYWKFLDGTWNDGNPNSAYDNGYMNASSYICEWESYDDMPDEITSSAHFIDNSGENASIVITEQNLSILPKETYKLNVAVYPGHIINSLIWSTSDAGVAIVDENGTVTAVGCGKATITATAGSVSATCIVTVINPAKAISLNKNLMTLTIGQSETLTATVTPADTTDSIEWKSSDAAIATVADGKVTAISAGTTSITVTAGSYSTVCVVTVEEDVPVDNSVTPNINGGASKLYEPWGLRYFAVYDGGGANRIADRGIAILKDKYYINGMTAEEFVAHQNAFVYLDSKGELGFEEPSTNNPNGRYYATLTEGIYSYDISAYYYVVPFAVMDNGETIYGTIKSNSMEKILRTNLTLPSITEKEKAICSCILSLKDSVAAHYAASGIPGASIDMDVPRGSSQSAAKSTVTPAASGITPNIVAGASRLIEPWGLRYFATYTENSNIADHGVVILCDKYFDASYNTAPDEMRLNANAYVFTESDGTLLYEKISGRYYATVTEGISSKDISDVYYVVPYVVLKDGSYVYGTVKYNSMLKIMNTNLGIASIPETEKAVTRDIIALYEAVKAYYAS